ncbi:hypothetical protein ABW21_db0203354 [Orbilia brochopaga]|nr:hypothetical protein ABW21_db0203354 [Drechslerella brochopaga]
MRYSSPRSAWKNLRSYSTHDGQQKDFASTGPGAVSRHDFVAGKLGCAGILLDTNMIRPILEDGKFARWLAEIRKHTGVVTTTRGNLVEHCSSGFLLKSRKHYSEMYEETENGLAKLGITVIDGPNSTTESASLCTRVMFTDYHQRLDAAQRKPTAEERKEAEEILSDGWEGILKKSRDDAAFAAEATVRGLALVTFDMKFHGHFKRALDRNGVLAYVIRRKWLEEST